ncbi:bilirubin oxidase precursor [Amylocarpus encephaloides]|uniref:Bilirubin oxidase n=1 Tax=Amylocarpus encephaloides TaxID=45428 RepID=A0A9P8C0R1_9HELO|nr:bilirubin oxidase precursor [Amylocarpus encephaloides]
MGSISLLLSSAAVVGLAQAAVIGWKSPVYTNTFAAELPIPTVIKPSTSYTNTENGRITEFYELEIKSFERQIYPDIKATTFWGYNGLAPGPTFKVTKGVEAVVRVKNTIEQEQSVHLHGSFSRSPFDGWALDTIKTGEYKDYYYPNQQNARTLWYHDHAEGKTQLNVNHGLAGMYLIEDPAMSAKLALPQGNYDIPLVLDSKQFDAGGQIAPPNLHGDVIMVNAQPWPFLNVENRKYRFRMLNGSPARGFKLTLVDEADTTATALEFTVVGSDSGFLSESVKTKEIILGQAERYEIVIDFEQYEGKNLTLKNARDFNGEEDYPQTDKVMQFRVGTTTTSQDGNGAVPLKLVDLEKFEDHPTVDQTYTFAFDLAKGKWLINGVGFSDGNPGRVLASPKQGTVQRWKIVNPNDGRVFAPHPVHVHLVDFQVMSRVGGRGVVAEYEQKSLKDVVYVAPGETVEVLANFAPWSGLYMFHCHNLGHEDNDMMAAFDATQVDLTELGYPQDILFNDPMAPDYRPQKFTVTDLDDIKVNTLPQFQKSNAYPDVPDFESALSSWHKTHVASSTAAVAPRTLATVVKARPTST